VTVVDTPKEGARIVAVCHTHPEERAFACQEQLAAGRAVLSLSPPARGVRAARQLAENAPGAHLEWEAPVVDGGFCEEAQRQLRGVEGLVYLSLRVSLPRIWWETGRGEGLVESEAWWILPFLEGAVAPVDTVAAQTRALQRRDGPAEDMLVAHIELADGVEAAVEAHALAAPEGAASVRLEAWGARGGVHLERDLHADRLRGLRRQYARLCRGERSPWFDAVASAAASRWIDQSARLAVRVHRRKREME
jgi:hypothetical protein